MDGNVIWKTASATPVRSTNASAWLTKLNAVAAKLNAEAEALDPIHNPYLDLDIRHPDRSPS
jgi:hypothetical protein